MMFDKKIKEIVIKEVAPRDGLQNEKKLSMEVRREFVEKLVDAGIKHIEVGSFANPQKVPQMEGTKELIKQLAPLKSTSNFFALVFTPEGMKEAVQAGIGEVSVLVAASETFNNKNIGCTTEEGMKRVGAITRIAGAKNARVRGYVGMAFGCPYEGEVLEENVIRIAEKMRDMGCYEIVLADTIGHATPSQVQKMIQRLKENFDLNGIGMHFHDTTGQALSNTITSLENGVTIFDSSTGGLGGCPFAKGAKGNISTEEMVHLAQTLGVDCGIEPDKLRIASSFIKEKLQ